MALTQSLINKNYIQYPTTLYTGATKATLGGYYGFDPRSIQGCELWLDSAYASNVTVSSGNVTTWINRSIVITQDFNSGTATYGNPQNDLKTINIVNPNTFTGTDATVADLQTYDFAIFAVVNLTRTSKNRFIISKNYLGTTGSVYWYLSMSSSNTVVFECKNAAGDVANAVSSSITAGWAVISVTYDNGGNINLYINGTLQSNTGTGSTSSLTTTALAKIGGTDNLDISTIQIGEILLYNQAESPILSSKQQQQIEGYLASKWSITLPAPLYTCVKPFLTQFRPPDIPTCVVWLDGTDPDSINPDAIFTNFNNQKIKYTQWLDKSGQNHNATAARSSNASTMANKYSYSNTGNPLTTGMYFKSSTVGDSGTKDVSTLSVMTIPITLRPATTRNTTMFIVFNPISLTSTNYTAVGFDDHNTANQCPTLQVDSGHVYILNHITGGGNTVCTITDSGIVSNSTVICTLTFNGLVASLYENDKGPSVHSIAAPGSPNANILLSGCIDALNNEKLKQTFAGYINEVIIYQNTTTSILTSSQIDQVQAYLAWKWGGQSSGFVRTSNYFTKFPPATAVGV